MRENTETRNPLIIILNGLGMIKNLQDLQKSFIIDSSILQSFINGSLPVIPGGLRGRETAFTGVKYST